MNYVYANGKKPIDRYRLSSQLAAVIANMQNLQKREEFLKALSYLSKEEQDSLRQRLDLVKSDLERWLIISDVVKNIQDSSLYQQSQSDTDVDRNKRRQMLLFAFGALLVGGSFIYLILKKL